MASTDCSNDCIGFQGTRIAYATVQQHSLFAWLKNGSTSTSKILLFIDGPQVCVGVDANFTELLLRLRQLLGSQLTLEVVRSTCFGDLLRLYFNLCPLTQHSVRMVTASRHHIEQAHFDGKSPGPWCDYHAFKKGNVGLAFEWPWSPEARPISGVNRRHYYRALPHYCRVSGSAYHRIDWVLKLLCHAFVFPQRPSSGLRNAVRHTYSLRLSYLTCLRPHCRLPVSAHIGTTPYDDSAFCAVPAIRTFSYSKGLVRAEHQCPASARLGDHGMRGCELCCPRYRRTEYGPFLFTAQQFVLHIPYGWFKSASTSPTKILRFHVAFLSHSQNENAPALVQSCVHNALLAPGTDRLDCVGSQYYKRRG